MEPIGTRKELYLLEPWRYGWQRFGEHMDNTFLDSFIEGAWMTKNNGKYYLQYGAPGTKFSGYADGVLVGDGPLGPFTPQSMPFSYKPGGFARGAGHGSTFYDNWGNWWHVSTISISVKNNFERRLGFWPAGFDKDGVMYCNTAFGDYPSYLPDGKEDHLKSRFTGWMLLNYKKPVMVSSTFGSYNANNAVDEDIKTYWSAATQEANEWIQTDLGAVSTVIVLRTPKDKRSAWLKWCPVDNAYAYNIYMGTDPEKLYNCIMVYDSNEYWLKALDNEMTYYFSIEAINENGVGPKSKVLKVE
jgi:hypothetical protein